MKKSIVLLVVILSLAFAAVAGAQDTYKIGYACNNYNDLFQTVIQSYAKAFAEENGIEFQSADGRDDEILQQDQIKAFIEDGVDALVVVAVNPMGVDPIIKMAADAKIPLVFVNRNPFTADDGSDIPDGVYYVGSNEIDAGIYQAKYVIDKLGEDAECGYVVLMGQLSNPASKLRTDGNEEGFKDYPGYKMLDKQTGDWQRDKGLALTENWIQAYGDQLCAVISNNDDMAMGAIKALEDKGMKDKVLVLGVDLIDDAKVAIEEGRLDCSVKQDGKGQGEGAMGVALAALKGEDVDKLTVVPFVPVSIENLEEHK
ncbi:MAG: substrate-binding domain-containing protein [Anaerolineaceae bacterium]|nr:substrate-binding domain-containing protein [Anaerolineaceae bacterium]